MLSILLPGKFPSFFKLLNTSAAGLELYGWGPPPPQGPLSCDLFRSRSIAAVIGHLGSDQGVSSQPPLSTLPVGLQAAKPGPALGPH